MKRTLSIGSRVPPAVTSTPTPDQVGGVSSASQTAISCAGSGSRPIPYSPCDPSSPSAGGMTVTPRLERSWRFAWVAGCRYMRLFIAGATATGHAAASAAVVSRLSAWPLASLAIVFALAGAIKNRSARSTSARWLIGARSGSGSPGYEPRAGSGPNSETSTGAPVIPSNDVLPTNRSLVGVCTTRTE